MRGLRSNQMRIPLRTLFAGVAALLAMPIAGCSHLSGYPPPAVGRPQDVLNFAQLYGQNCAACHGSKGQDGPATDLANPEYEALVDDTTLSKWITAGMPGTQMPAFAQSAGGMLTDAQVSAIVNGMRKMWLRPNAFSGATPPAYAQNQPGDARRGQQTYQARCAICHTASNTQLTNPIYLALVSDQSLRSTIIAGSPDIGQPDWRHDSQGSQPAPPLSNQDVDDVIAYLASLRNSAPAYVGTAAYPQAAPAGGKN